MRAPDGLGTAFSTPPAKAVAAGRERGEGNRLAQTLLAHVPLAVAVIDAELRLSFWNQQAAILFGAVSGRAAGLPRLADILKGIETLTPVQRDRITAFAASHIASGDRAEPDGSLRVSLGRDRRIVIQIRGIGLQRWMVQFFDGKMALAAGLTEGSRDNGDAWLDALTGLSNRRHFNQILHRLVDDAAADATAALVMIDLDRFKRVNDTLGHPAGDALLCLVAQRMRREIREDDVLVRLGGDEFVILLPRGERAEILAARLVDVLSSPFLVEGQVVNIGASAGVAYFPEHGPSADDFVRHADLALYDAKSAGGGTVRRFDPAMAAEASARRDLETDLRKALALGEFSLAYQAQLNVKNQTLTGFEALLRWNHPVRGIVPPAVFIPVAEEIGCIVALGEWVLRSACHEAARWPEPLSLAVNVSARQLEDSERLFSAVQAALVASGLPAERLELEVTESSLLAKDTHVVDTLHRLRAAGIRITMDDFGTGYSSLSQLRSFPFSKIKIDRSCIAGLGSDAQSTAVIRAIAAFGAGLGMTTIAEGVETAQQAALVEADGCTDIQGYLISRPIPASEIDALLRQHPAGTETTSIAG